MGRGETGPPVSVPGIALHQALERRGVFLELLLRPGRIAGRREQGSQAVAGHGQAPLPPRVRRLPLYQPLGDGEVGTVAPGGGRELPILLQGLAQAVVGLRQVDGERGVQRLRST